MSAARAQLDMPETPTPETASVIYPDLAGKTAVVTGGSKGIGAETAAAFARNHVAVAVVGRDEAAIERVVEGIAGDGGRAIGVAADCTSEADVRELSAEVRRRLGPVDLVACFAGGYGEPVSTAVETSAHWRQVVDGNLTATFNTIAGFLPDLRARRGAIVTMASSAARQATQASAAYTAAKAGVVALTRHLAAELAGDGVRVNCLAPSTIENERVRAHMTEEARRRLGESFPLGRIGQPADVAAATLFLASQSSSWITGITLDIAGGKVMP